MSFVHFYYQIDSLVRPIDEGYRRFFDTTGADGKSF
jgi:hypothetical protein